MIGGEIGGWGTILSYTFLYLAVIFLWIPFKMKIPAWSILFTIACFWGLLSGQIEPYAVVSMFVIGYALYYSEKKSAQLQRRVLAGVLVLFLAYGLGAHALPYFHNLKVVSEVYISKDGIPFTLYLNFDKTLVGLFILGFTGPLLSSREEWLLMFRQTIPKMVLFIFILVSLAVLAGEVHFDPKLPECLPIWLLTNLLFVCMAEEAFFRGFVQRNLALLFRNFAQGNLLALTITALLFGFAHYAGGIAYSIWGTIAGFGYGWLYQHTKKIESSIIPHFCLNVIHFLLFTYPAIG